MKNLVLSSILILATTTGYSQEDSYIIARNGEKFTGKVQISVYQNSTQSIVIKYGKKRKSFRPYQVKEVNIKGDTYHPLRLRDSYQMALLIKEGYLTYYKFSSDESSTLTFDTPLLVKKDGDMQEVPNLGFRKRLMDYLGDCENVVTKLDSKEYGRGDLDKIIDEYNLCIADHTAKLNEKTAVLQKNHSKSDQIEKIKTEVSKLDMAARDEVLEMLTDVQSKLKEGKAIPGYLVSGLKEQLSKELAKKLDAALQ